MWMRLIRFHGLIPERIRLTRENYRAQDLHLIEEVPGFMGIAFGENHISGSLGTVTFWETEEAMHESERFSAQARQHAAATLDSGDRMLVDRFEVTLATDLDRLALDLEWGIPWMRMIWFKQLTSEGIQAIARRYRTEELAWMQMAPGFDGIALGENHELGTLATVSFWDSDDSLRGTERSSQVARERAAAEAQGPAGQAPAAPLVDRFEISLTSSLAPAQT